jgi:eukaryotic-like serine/threonine-protein kinase
VTTGSLEALRKYTQALRAYNAEADMDKAAALLGEAVAIDSGFAMALRMLGNALGALGEPKRMSQAFTKAFQHRDRLTERERLLIEGDYYDVVTNEREKAITAYRTLLESYPNDLEALNNLGIIYNELRQYSRAEEMFRRVFELDSVRVQGYYNLIGAQVSLGKWREAAATLENVSRRLASDPWVNWVGSFLASARGDYGTAEDYVRSLSERFGASYTWRAYTTDQFARLAAVQGRLADATRYQREGMEASAEEGESADYVGGAIFLALLDIQLRRQPARGLKQLEAALARYPLDSMQPVDRPYLDLALVYALADKPDRARALMSEYERVVDPETRRGSEQDRRGASGELALAEGRVEDAITDFQYQASHGACRFCGLGGLARAIDRSGQTDSTIAAYERYVGTSELLRLPDDAMELAAAYRRLGELYEERDEREKARRYYTRFIELWKDCDPELRREVNEARRRLANVGLESGT